jgi:hypothetical protein
MGLSEIQPGISWRLPGLGEKIRIPLKISSLAE